MIRLRMSHAGLATVLLLVLVAVPVLFGCQGQQPVFTPPAPTTAPKAAAPTLAPQPPAAPTTAVVAVTPTAIALAPAAPTAAPEALKVGISTALTGPAMRVGVAAERMIRFAIDDVNARGGVKVGGKMYRLDAVTADDKSTSEGGREAANRLINAEKVRVVMGGTSSPNAGAQTFTEPAKVLLFGLSVLDRGLGPSYPLTFNFSYHTLMRSGALFDWLALEHPKVKTIVGMTSDDATGRTNTNINEASAKARGITYVGKEFYPLDTKDFNPLVTRAQRMNPDAFDLVSVGGRAALHLAIMKALQEQGVRGPVFALAADAGPMREGAAIMEGFTTAVLADYQSPVVGGAEKEVLRRYVQKYGEADLELTGLLSYNMPLVLKQAMEKASTVTDTQQIGQAIQTGEFDTIFGKNRFVGIKTFGAAATLEQPVYLSKVEAGKLVTFKALKGTLP